MHMKASEAGPWLARATAKEHDPLRHLHFPDCCRGGHGIEGKSSLTYCLHMDDKEPRGPVHIR